MDAKQLLELWESEEGRNELRTLLLGPDDLRVLQEQARTEGRCASLKTADGLPCRRFPKPGFSVCFRHGELAPQTTAKATRLLAEVRLPAINWLMDTLDQAQLQTCHECGYPNHSLKEKRRIDAVARVVLDRTGLGPSSKVSVVDERDAESGLQIDLLNEQERLELGRLIMEVRDLKERVRARLDRDAATLTLAHGDTQIPT